MSRLRLYPGLVNLNGNLLCAVDVETTGLNPEKHDIIEIAVLPLDNDFKPQKQSLVPWFHMTMKPRRPENIDLDALEVNRSKLVEICNNALDADRVADLFMEWFEKLNLGIEKRISPLAHNWIFDVTMIRNWIGPLSTELIFDGRYRDTMAFALSQNDCAEQRGTLCPYPKVNLKYLASTLKVDSPDAHNALPDCRITAEIYTKMIRAHQ